MTAYRFLSGWIFEFPPSYRVTWLQSLPKNWLRPILMKHGMMLEVDETFTMIWLSRSSEVRVKVRRWPQSLSGLFFQLPSSTVNAINNLQTYISAFLTACRMRKPFIFVFCFFLIDSHIWKSSVSMSFKCSNSIAQLNCSRYRVTVQEHAKTVYGTKQKESEKW